MKLIKITDDFWANPEQISSVFYEPRDLDTKNPYYPLFISISGGIAPRCVRIYGTKEQAEEHLLRLVEYIHQEANE